MSAYKFRDNPQAPVYFIDRLHEVIIVNGFVRFVPANLKVEAGEIIGSPTCFIEMRHEAGLEAATFAVQRLASGLFVPAVVNKLKQALWLN